MQEAFLPRLQRLWRRAASALSSVSKGSRLFAAGALTLTLAAPFAAQAGSSLLTRAGSPIAGKAGWRCAPISQIHQEWPGQENLTTLAANPLGRALLDDADKAGSTLCLASDRPTYFSAFSEGMAIYHPETKTVFAVTTAPASTLAHEFEHNEQYTAEKSTGSCAPFIDEGKLTKAAQYYLAHEAGAFIAEAFLAYQENARGNPTLLDHLLKGLLPQHPSYIAAVLMGEVLSENPAWKEKMKEGKSLIPTALADESLSRLITHPDFPKPHFGVFTRSLLRDVNRAPRLPRWDLTPFSFSAREAAQTTLPRTLEGPKALPKTAEALSHALGPSLTKQFSAMISTGELRQQGTPTAPPPVLVPP